MVPVGLDRRRGSERSDEGLERLRSGVREGFDPGVGEQLGDGGPLGGILWGEGAGS